MKFRNQLFPLSALAAAVVASFSTTAEEQPIELDKFVVTAAGYEQKVVDAPASISVITQEDLRSRPYVTLLDAVRELEGVDVGETRDKTGQGTISIRGMGADYTLILIDGRRQNNHGDIYPNNFGGNQFNHIPPLDAIERIEVIRGPASTLYGADALGGVINIITKKVTDDWTGSASISRTFQEYDEYGADTTADFNVAGPLIENVLGMELRGSIYKRDASEPEYDSVTDPNGDEQTRELGFGRGGKTTDNTNKSIGIGFNWNVADNQSLTFDYDTSKQVYDNEPLADGSFPLGTVDSIDTIWQDRGGVVSPRSGYAQDQEFTRDQWAISHEGEWSFGNSLVSLQNIETNNNGRTIPLSVSERLLLQEMYDGTGDYAGLSEDERRAIAEDTFLPRPERTMESSQYVLDAKLELPVQDLAGDHLFIVGGQYVDAELTDGVFGREEGDSGRVSDFTTYSLFAEDSWTMVPDFTLTAGLRYDDHDAFGSNVSPRLYAVYSLTPEWTVKGGVSSGYKTPKTTDLYDGIIGFGGQGTFPFAGNPDLEPEKSRNTEAAIYWESMENRHSFNATIFHNRFEDKIARSDSVPTCAQTGGERPCVNLGEYEQLGGRLILSQPINIDDALIRGAEVAGRLQIIDSLALRGNYTYTDSRQLSGSQEGQPLTNTAEHMSNVTLEWDINAKLSAQLTNETRSARFRGVDENNDPLYYKDYRVLNLGANYAVNSYFSVYARINNLLDEDFTTYSVRYDDANDDGVFDAGDDEVIFEDDYNNKDKRRNLWIGLNVRF